jgi:ABC-type sugar transport system permease subunit
MKSHSATPYLFIFPTMAVIALIFVYPICEIFRLSLIVPGSAKISFSNFQFIFSDSIFWTSLKHNLLLLILVPIILVLALIIGIFLYERVKGWLFHRSMVFLPYVMPIAVMGITFSYLYQYNGLLNNFLRSAGLGQFALNWLGNKNLVLPTIMTVIIWQQTGFGVILFLARLLSLPVEVTEAATVDGVNWFQRNLYIILPQLKSIIMFFTVNEAISMLTWVFSYVYVISAGGPGFSSYVLELYLWQAAFSLRSPGVASAIAVFLLLAAVILVILSFRYIGREEDAL